MQWADEACDGRVVSCLEGGYNLDTLGGTVVTHVRTYLRPRKPCVVVRRHVLEFPHHPFVLTNKEKPYAGRRNHVRSV